MKLSPKYDSFFLLPRDGNSSKDSLAEIMLPCSRKVRDNSLKGFRTKEKCSRRTGLFDKRSRFSLFHYSDKLSEGQLGLVSFCWSFCTKSMESHSFSNLLHRLTLMVLRNFTWTHFFKPFLFCENCFPPCCPVFSAYLNDLKIQFYSSSQLDYSLFISSHSSPEKISFLRGESSGKKTIKNQSFWSASLKAVRP